MKRILLITLLSMPSLVAMNTSKANEQTIQDVLKLILEDKRDMMNRLEAAQHLLHHTNPSVAERGELEAKIKRLESEVKSRSIQADNLISRATK